MIVLWNVMPCSCLVIWLMGTNVSGVAVTSIFKSGDMFEVNVSLLPVFFKLLYSHAIVTIHTVYMYDYHSTWHVCVVLFTTNTNVCFQDMGLLGCSVSWQVGSLQTSQPVKQCYGNLCVPLVVRIPPFEKHCLILIVVTLTICCFVYCLPGWFEGYHFVQGRV
jgi:hypothetical protein